MSRDSGQGRRFIPCSRVFWQFSHIYWVWIIHFHWICVRNHSWLCTYVYFFLILDFGLLMDLWFRLFTLRVNIYSPVLPVLYTCATMSTVMAEKLSEPTIKPLYLKDSDIKCKDKGRITDFDLMESITAVVGNSLHCLQQDRNLWRFYLKDKESRDKLLSDGCEINNISLSFFWN